MIFSARSFRTNCTKKLKKQIIILISMIRGYKKNPIVTTTDSIIVELYKL